MIDTTYTITDDIFYGRQALRLGEPWIVPDAIDFIRTVIQPTWSVFEWGAGGSTIFWLRNCAELITIEHNPEWVMREQDMIVAAQLPPKSVHAINFIPGDAGSGAGVLGVTYNTYADAILAFPVNTFDLVSIDGEASSRSRCITNAIPRIKPGGWLLLDNSDWYTVTMGWERQDWVARQMRYIGLEPSDWQTSIFRKPL